MTGNYIGSVSAHLYYKAACLIVRPGVSAAALISSPPGSLKAACLQSHLGQFADSLPTAWPTKSGRPIFSSGACELVAAWKPCARAQFRGRSAGQPPLESTSRPDTLLSIRLLSPAPALQSARTDKMRIKSEKSLTALMEEHLVSTVASISALQTLLPENTTVSLGDTQMYCARANGRCWAQYVYLI